MKSSPEVLNAFSKLGEDFTNIPDSIKEVLCLYVLNLYCPSRPKYIISIADLRWHLYMQSQVEPEMLPPTQAALDFKITKSHFINKIWRNAHEAVPIIPDPEIFGWKLIYDVYEGVLTDREPIPNVIVELNFCKCQTECETMQCKCKRNNIRCTEMCSCTNCQNCDDGNDDSDLYFDSGRR